MDTTEEARKRELQRSQEVLRRERRKRNIASSRGERLRVVTGEIASGWKTADIAPSPAALKESLGGTYLYVLTLASLPFFVVKILFLHNYRH